MGVLKAVRPSCLQSRPQRRASFGGFCERSQIEYKIFGQVYSKRTGHAASFPFCILFFACNIGSVSVEING